MFLSILHNQFAMIHSTPNRGRRRGRVEDIETYIMMMMDRKIHNHHQMVITTNGITEITTDIIDKDHIEAEVAAIIMERPDIIEIEDITPETIITIMGILTIQMIIIMDSIITTQTHGINQLCF